MVEEKKLSQVQLVVTKLANEEYGVPITQVQEIIQISSITRVPGIPGFVEGVINLRGKIIPVVDLRKRFNLTQEQFSENTRIVVTTIDNQSIGLLVDSVSEVIRLSVDAIDPIPPKISQICSEYLSGIGKFEKRLIILLNLEKLLTDFEKSAMKKIEVSPP